MSLNSEALVAAYAYRVGKMYPTVPRPCFFLAALTNETKAAKTGADADVPNARLLLLPPTMGT